MKYTAWLMGANGQAGASFASGNTLGECQSNAHDKASEILQNIRRREGMQGPARSVHFTTGTNQYVVSIISLDHLACNDPNTYRLEAQ